jgi:hypothetical protein
MDNMYVYAGYTFTIYIQNIYPGEPQSHVFALECFGQKTVFAFVLLLRRSCGAMFPNVARFFLFCACVSTNHLELQFYYYK